MKASLPVTSTPIGPSSQPLAGGVTAAGVPGLLAANAAQLPANSTFSGINNPLNNNSMQHNKMPGGGNVNVALPYGQLPGNNMAATNMLKSDGMVQQQPQQQQLLKQQQQMQQQQQLKPNAMPGNNKMAGGNAANLQMQMQMGGMMGAGLMNIPGMPGNLSANGTNNLIGALDNKSNMQSLMANLLNDNKLPGMNNFDEVEQSLASMEQSIPPKTEINPMNNMDLLNDMSTLMAKSQEQSLMQQLGFDSMPPVSHDGNNGFGMDAAMALNGMAGVSRNGGTLGSMLNMPQMPHPNAQADQIPSIFDPANALPRNMSAMANNQVAASMAGGGGGNGVPNPIMPSAGSFRPKPIADLLPNHDKKTPPPPIADPAKAASAAHLRNPIASSWSSLAAANSPQSTPTSNKTKQPTMAMDAFQQFRNKAKEKADKQKMLEIQEMKRSSKEAAEKQKQIEQQQKLKRDEVDASR